MMATPETGAETRMSKLERARYDLSRALVLAKREVIDMGRDWRIIAPVVILTVIFPSLANFGAGRMMGFVEQYGADLIGERLIPFLMLVVGFFPVSFSLIIALESFVGEKERKSLEPLLSSPMTNLQIYLGKMLSSTIPPIIGSLLGIAVYLIGIKLNVNYLPPFAQILQVILLSVMHALVMVAGAVIVSSQVTSVRAANLLASFIIIPFAFLIQGEAWVMFDAQYDVLWWAFGALFALNILLIRMGIRLFNREQLLGKEIDELNLKASARRLWRMIWQKRPAEAKRGPWRWYREEVLGQFKKLVLPIALVAIWMIAAFFIGRNAATIFTIPDTLLPNIDWYSEISSFLVDDEILGVESLVPILLMNIRTLFIGSVLAVFTFGIGIILILMTPFALIGYLVVTMSAAGMDHALLFAAFIPHSIFEIPAALLAGATAVRLGMSVLAQPEDGALTGHWMRTLADCIRLWLLLILPLLVLAAATEVLVTPEIVMRVVGGA